MLGADVGDRRDGRSGVLLVGHQVDVACEQCREGVLGGAHAAHEWVTLDSLRAVTATLDRTIRRYVARKAAASEQGLTRHPPARTVKEFIN
ncbi:hypothetical protein GCM10009747_22870 [Agromyces humatus]|uniref:Uncharacterized protein n=1 Tax=Agromyces humatus TaxID=279573 RepID=A0ABN2KS40_9MICO